MQFHALFVLVQMLLLLMLSLAMHPAARPFARRALITGLSFMAGGYDQLVGEQAGFIVGGQDQDIPANGAIAIQDGVVILSKGSAGAYTLAAPVSGPQDQGGDDGITMQIISNTAFAHVVTTPANVLNGNKDTATYAAAIGSSITVRANGGLWLVIANNGVTLTEV